MIIHPRRLALAALALSLAACENGTDPEDREPAALQVVSGDLQPQATVGTELPDPLVVKVVDDRGRPVPGQIVSFVVTTGGGSVFAGAALTNRDGEARERWTLGTVAGDTQRVEARAVDTETGEPIVFATFRAVARAGAPTAITAENPDRTGTAGAALGTPLVVRATDAHGNGVPGTAVTWTVTAGGGTVQAAGGTTDATGRAQATWTLGSAIGTPQVVQAAAAGLTAARFTALAAPAAPLEIVQVGGEYQGAGAGQPLEHPIVLQVRQAGGGAPVAGVWVNGGAGTSPDSAQTDAQGRASFTWTLPTSTGWTSTFFSVAGTGLSVEATAYSSAVVPAQMELFDDLPYWYPDSDLRLGVLVNDAAGQPVPLFPLRGQVEAGGGTFTGIAAINGSGSPLWHTGPQEGVQRVRIEAGPVDLVVEKDIRRVWLWPLLAPGSTITSSTVLRVRASHSKSPVEGDPVPGDPRMFVTVDGRTTEMRTVRTPGLGYNQWVPYPTASGWVEGLTPGAKVAHFRLETTAGTFELDWPFVYQP